MLVVQLFEKDYLSNFIARLTYTSIDIVQLLSLHTS